MCTIVLIEIVIHLVKHILPIQKKLWGRLTSLTAQSLTAQYTLTAEYNPNLPCQCSCVTGVMPKDAPDQGRRGVLRPGTG